MDITTERYRKEWFEKHGETWKEFLERYYLALARSNPEHDAAFIRQLREQKKFLPSIKTDLAIDEWPKDKVSQEATTEDIA
eukprot:2159868-Rhodomonas_salina.1